jgi:hypothetical protein
MLLAAIEQARSKENVVFNDHGKVRMIEPHVFAADHG